MSLEVSAYLRLILFRLKKTQLALVQFQTVNPLDLLSPVINTQNVSKKVGFDGPQLKAGAFLHPPLVWKSTVAKEQTKKELSKPY